MSFFNILNGFLKILFYIKNKYVHIIQNLWRKNI